MTQAICDITTDEINVDVVVEPQADTMVEVANRAGGMEQVFHDNTLIGNGNSVDLGVNTDIIATKEYVDENKVDAYTKTEVDNKFTVANAQIDANADAIQKTREDFIEADSEIHQILNAHASELTTQRNDIDGLGDQVSAIESKIPDGTSDANPLINKQQLLDEEMDIREDLNSGLSELQTQITAQAAAIAGKQDELIAGDNIVISGNVISATGAGGGAGFDIQVVQELPATGQKGIIYLLAKDGTTPDVYDEYVWIESTQTFELIGTTQVDLTDYAKKVELDNYLPLSGGDMTGDIVFYKDSTFKGRISTTSDEGLEIQVGQYGTDRYFLNGDNFYATSGISLGNSAVPWSSGYITTLYNNTLATKDLTVGTDEGTLNIGITAGVATIATNNGLDIVAQTKFDTAPTTDDATEWADVNSTALVTKQQVTTALSTAGGGLPDQTGNAGKFLITDGTTTSWGSSYVKSEYVDWSSTTYYKINIGTVDGYTGTAASSSCVAIGTDRCGDNCISILGKAYYTGSVAIGYGSVAESFNGTAIGNNAKVYSSSTNKGAIAIGYGASVSYAKCAIQLGGNGSITGYTNSDANTFKVGNANGNFEMMSADGTIPAERMSATAGATGQVLTKTDTGMAWADASGGDGDIDCGVMS